MSNEMITQLPTVLTASLTDIIYAVQGYISPSSPGTSVQETLGQVATLMMSQTILSNAGNPNGAVAGNTYQLCWDTTDKILYVCTTTGSASTAVWTNPVSTALIAGANISLTTNSSGTTINAVGATGITWTSVAGTTQAMAVESGYVTTNASLTTLTLPATAAFGTIIYISGFGAGGWKVAQNASQQINVGDLASTSGTSGFIASTNQFDSIALLCAVANTNWVSLTGPQGNITVN